MDQVKKPLVSIIIPYYNKKETINRSIQNVSNQTYTNWELIIVDDRGQEPLEWHDEWSSMPIKILVNPQNLGAAQSRQRGQELAKGEFIAFLDADDWWGDRFLESCINKLNQENDCAGCYVNIIEVTNKGSKKRTNYSGLSNILFTVIAFRRPWQTSGILWRKNLVGSWGKLKTHEDSWFEVLTSKNNNKLLYVENENCYNDREGTNHLSYLNGKINSTVDQQKLFLMIYKEFWHQLDLKYKTILFHRLIRGQLKIYEYCPKYSKEMGNELMKLNPWLYWMRNQPLILRIIHYVLQNSSFKINF
jgi:glycosyltransferase involved in cell wall biosynthesis